MNRRLGFGGGLSRGEVTTLAVQFLQNSRHIVEAIGVVSGGVLIAVTPTPVD